MKTSQILGPFSIGPAQVEALGVNFADFVNQLLRAEAAAAGMEGGQLTTTHLVNLGDGGVDAGLHRATGTAHIPEGDSAWQFKAGDLNPGKCKTELRGASAALAVLCGGGVYRLVLGKDITAVMARNRRQALEEEAGAQGIAVRPGMFEVLNASDLAAWASHYPSLAVSPVLGGIGHVAEAFPRWSARYDSTGPWVESPTRRTLIDEIRAFVSGGSRDLRVEGARGIGKTRTVLEAFRGQDFAPLVAYVDAAEDLPPALIPHLQDQDRHAILVVDQCDAKLHDTLARRLRTASSVKLITLGEASGFRGVTTLAELGELEDEAVRRVAHSVPGLPPEHARVVVASAAGNPGLAQWLAEQAVQRPRAMVGQLIDKDVVSTFISGALPGGSELHACCALALLPNLKYDGDDSELGLLADAVDLDTRDLRIAARTLTDLRLLTKQGSYRSVGPHPVAVYLATVAWEDFGYTIQSGVIPRLDDSTAERLFQRAGECGDLPATKRAAANALAPGGRFEHLDVWSNGSEGILLQHLVPLAPLPVLHHLRIVLGEIDDDDLGQRCRHSHAVQWALERLAWRTATFSGAADLLLRIAAATARIDVNRDQEVRAWTNLFGIQPTTAARPAERMRYLRGMAGSTDRRHRLLTVTAARQVLRPTGFVLASAEAQGGVLVERRGTPATSEEAVAYAVAGIDLLGTLAQDTDQEVADLAVKALVDAIHPLLPAEQLRSHLARTIAVLSGLALSAARAKITHLEGLFARTTGHSLTGELAAFSAELPAPTPTQTVDFLAEVSEWDLPDGQLGDRLEAALDAVPEEDRVPTLLGVLDRRPAAAHQIGRMLGQRAPRDDSVSRSLVELADPNMALSGYLQAQVDAGDDRAFDDLLDSPIGQELDDSNRLWVSAFGPQSDAAWTRTLTLTASMRPSVGARSLFGWRLAVDDHRLRSLLDSWLPRIQTSSDYSDVVEFVGLAVHDRPAWIDSVDPVIADLVALRSRLDQLAVMGDYTWRLLARRQLTVQPTNLVTTLLDVADSDGYSAFYDPEGKDLLQDAISAAGMPGWRLLADRLHHGSWRIQSIVGSGAGNEADVEAARAWVDGDVERARTLAKLTIPGTEQLDPVARFLIVEFATDDQVSGYLRRGLFAEWNGELRADFFDTLIQRVQSWGTSGDEPAVVKQWITVTVTKLQEDRQTALERGDDTEA